MEAERRGRLRTSGDVRADDLRYLAAVAESRRMVAAARTFGVDHATVSRRIRALERALGTRLLSKTPDGWELTDAGRAVINHARDVQSAVEHAMRAASGTDSTALTGTVRVTAADGFGTHFVVPALAQVRREHPGLDVELVTGARELTLRDANFDLALTVGPVPPTRLHTELLCEYDSAFYASHDYFRQYGDPATVEELSSHSLIFFMDSLQRVRELRLSDYVKDAHVNFSSTNIFAIAEAARRGAGIALMAKFMARSYPELRQITAPMPLARVQVTLAIRPDALSRRDVQLVRDALMTQVRQRQEDMVASAHGSTSAPRRADSIG